MQSRRAITRAGVAAASRLPVFKLTRSVRTALVVPQGPQAAGAGSEGRTAGGGTESGPDGIVLKTTGLTARAEVRIGRCQARRVHPSHT